MIFKLYPTLTWRITFCFSNSSNIFRCPNIAVERPEFRYDIIPSKGTVFGLLLDGVIYRAVRENTLQV